MKKITLEDLAQMFLDSLEIKKTPPIHICKLSTADVLGNDDRTTPGPSSKVFVK